MALDVKNLTHDNTTYTGSLTNIQYTIKYTYTKVEADDHTDITLVTSWKSPSTVDEFIDYSTYTYKVTSSNLNKYETDIENQRQIQQTKCEAYLETLIGNVNLPTYTKTRDYTSEKNGITFEITNDCSVQYIGGNADSEFDCTSARINVTINWRNKEFKQYVTYFENSVLTITKDNYADYISTTSQLQAQVLTTIENKNNDLMTKVLDTLIGTVPASKTVTNVITSADETKKVYLRTVISGSNTGKMAAQDLSSLTLYCTTVAGVSTNYGVNYATNVPFEITANNYQTWQEELAEYLTTEQNNVKNTDFYKMLSIAIPAPIKRTGYVAHNGLIYDYTITCVQDDVTINSNQISYTTVIRTNDYTMTWSSKSVTFDTHGNTGKIEYVKPNGTVGSPVDQQIDVKYTNADAMLATLLEKEENDLKNYLDTLNFTTTNKIKIATDYGFNTRYGTKLDETIYNVVYSNYRSYGDNIIAISALQEREIYDLEMYKMYNVEPMPDYSGAYVKNASTFRGIDNYGIVYFYHVDFAHDGYNDTTHTVKYEITYGNTPECNSKYFTNFITFDINTYQTAMATLEAEVEQKIVEMKAFIDNLNTTNVPDTNEIATIKLRTEYGFDTDYGNELGTANCVIINENYTGRSSYVKFTTNQLESNIVDTALYKLYNVLKPNDIFKILIKNPKEFTYKGVKRTVGIVYHYEVIFKQGATTGSTNEITYQINYGSTKAYDTVFTSGSIIFNINNYSTAVDTLLSEVQGKLDEFETYITNITVPDTVYRPKQSASVEILSEYGLTENYGSVLGDTITNIEASNYKTHTKLLTDIMEDQENNINNAELFKMINMQLPDPIIESYIPKNNGIKFDYDIRAMFYQVTEEDMVIKCITTWDESRTYSKRYEDRELTIKLEDRATAYVKISTMMNEAKQVLRAYLDTLLPMPVIDDFTQKFNTNSGVQIWVKTVGVVQETELDSQYTIKYTTKYDMSSKYRYTYSSEEIFEVNSTNYSNWLDRYHAKVNEEQLKIKNLNVFKMLNIVKPSNINRTHSANGIVYRYRINLTQNKADFNTNSFNYTVYWIQGSQENIFTTKTIVFTRDNYSGAETVFTNTLNAEESALKTYLNSLKFSQSQTVKLVTDYGLDTKYGSALSTINHKIDAVSYKAHTNNLIAAATREQATIENTNAYHVLNIAKPMNINDTKIATNGQKYFYRFRFDQSTTSLTGNRIDYVLEYGITSNFGSTYTSGTFNFDANNYASATSTTENTSKQKIADLLKFFNNIIGVVTLPNTIDNSWETVSGSTMNVRTRFEIASIKTDSQVSSEQDSVTVKYITEYSLDNSYSTVWSNNKTYAITPSTYSNYTNALINAAGVEQKALKDSNIMKMLNVKSPDSIDSSFKATNGIVYNYAVRFVQSNTTISTNEIIITVYYGSSANPNIVYSQTPKVFTPTTCSNATADLLSLANTQINALKAFLNAYVPSDDITIPSPKTYTYTSKSGKKFYLKTTFTKGDYNDNHCAVRYVTVWGFTNTYGETYSDLIYNITPINYQGYLDDLNTCAQREFEKVILAKFGVWDVVIPNNVNETYTTTGKDTYYIKTTFEQSTTDNQINNIKYIVTYGTTLKTNTANLWSENTHTVTDSNVSGAVADLTNLASAEVLRLEEFLEAPNVVLPNDTERTYTKNGFIYSLQVVHTKGNRNNIVISTGKIDGIVFGTATTNTFLSQKDVNATLASVVETKIDEMIAKCDKSPANKTASYIVGDSIFDIQTEFVKQPGVIQASCITKLDGLVYKTSNVNINANSIDSNLTTIASTGDIDVAALKRILDTVPSTKSEVHTSGGFNFDIKTTYTKSANSSIVHYIISSDNSVYDSGDFVLDVPVLTKAISDLSAMVTDKTNELKRKLTNASPKNSSEILTYNGFQYLVTLDYAKESTSKSSNVVVGIDGVEFGKFSKLVDQSSIDNDMATIIAEGTRIRTSLINLINNSPKDKSYIYPINGFNYAIGTTYKKIAGNQNVTIQTLLDGRVYKTINGLIEADNIANSLNGFILSTSDSEVELKEILSRSPANNNNEVYPVDDIKYYVGATYTKASSSTIVAVSIMLDNNVVETYSENVLAESVETDIERIISGANTRIAELKRNLPSLANTTDVVKFNGFNFILERVFSKDLENHTITISNKVDGVLSGTPYTTTFNKDNIADYKTKALNMAQNIVNVLKTVPANVSNDFTINGFGFKVGIDYEKASNDDKVYVYTLLDGVRFDDPKVITFNINNIGAISEKGLSELSILKERLSNVPANYSNDFAIGGLNFRISTNFSKKPNEDTIQITNAIDGETYGTAITQSFDINNIGNITLETSTREDEIKDILRNAPEDSTEVYTIRRLNFNIQKFYQKNAGSKVVTSFVKMDGNQYEQTHQEEYNIANLSALTGYNDALVDSLKNKLTNSIPNDIHTTYTRNQFTFVVDIYFTKSVNSDVINVEYYIDSADLANTLH